MKFKRLTSASLLSLAVLAGCGQEVAQKGAVSAAVQPAQVNKERIKAHVEFLADDTLKGRDTGSEGYQIAANYVISNFKQLGLTPQGEFNSFEQVVTFRRAFLDVDSAKMSIENANGKADLALKDDFLMFGSAGATESMVEAETVFVGYGVASEQFGYDDYQGLDVDGKIVVALTGRPDDLPSEEGAHIGSTGEKARLAAEHGAVGFITIHTPKREKIRAFETTAKHVDSPNYSWLKKDGQPFGRYPELKAGAYVNSESAKALFEGAERSLEALFNDDTEKKAIKGFNLNAKVSMASKSRHEEVTSPNVVATLEGSDPKLKDEYVVFSAHLDHIGVDSHSDEHGDENEDVINNGALDNASGVSTLLEMARLIASQPVAPKRSILFVVVTGEEKGLLGSSYFANNPTVPAMQMVANVNLDMPVLLYPFADVIAFGSTHSTLGNIVEAAGKKVDIGLSPDPMPEQALFTRSDHYNFVKAGIPSVFLMTGFKSKDPEIDGGKTWGDFLKNHYHQHSDQTDLPINWDAAASFVEVNMAIGMEIANGEQRPTWNEGDFFGKTFAQ